MDEDAILAIVGAVVFGLIGISMSGAILGMIGVVVGFVVGANLLDWLEKAKKAREAREARNG